MKYIRFSEFNRNYLLFLSLFIISIIKDVIKDSRKLTKDMISSFVKYYSYSLSDLLAIIPIIIIAIRSRNIKKEETFESNQTIKSKNQNALNEIINKNRNKKIINIFRLQLIISIFDFVGKYANVTYSIIITKTFIYFKKIELNTMYTINFITTCILCLLILHSPIYRHHYFSLVINLLLLIGFTIYDQIEIFKKDNWDVLFYYNIMKILCEIFYSFEDVLSKIILSFYSISPYNFILYRGLFVVFFSILFSIPFIFVDIPDENGNNSIVFTRFWKIYDNKLDFLYVFGLGISNFIYNVNIFFIVDKFSPTHYTIGTSLERFGSLLTSIFQGGSINLEFFLKLALCILLIIVSAVYNEIIILNFCGLQKFTKLFMEKEAKKDLMQMEFNLISRCNTENDLDTEGEISKKDEMSNGVNMSYISNKS